MGKCIFFYILLYITILFVCLASSHPLLREKEINWSVTHSSAKQYMQQIDVAIGIYTYSYSLYVRVCIYIEGE